MGQAKGAGFLRLGELLDGNPRAVAQTWRQGGFTSMFDFPLGFAIGDVFCRGQSPAKLAAAFTNDRRYPDPSALVTLVDNHDLPRVMSLCGGDVDKVSAALAFLFTARGIPSMIWGTEAGFAGEKEPDNRPSMRFAPHPLKESVTRWLALRRTHEVLATGAVRVLAATPDAVALGRVSPDALAVVWVSRPGAARPPLPAPWSELSWTKERGGPGFELWVSDRAPGKWAALAAQVDRQWRTGQTTRPVRFAGPAGGRVVGSGPELGDWQPDASVPVGTTLALPVGGVFEFKGVRAKGAGWEWADGDNQLLFVPEAGEALTVQVAGPR